MLYKCFCSVRQKALIPQVPCKVWKRDRNIACFEPPYLESLKPKFPCYEAVTVQVKGYDFPILESYQKFVHSVAEYLFLDVESCWAHPARHFSIIRYKRRTTVAETSYKLLMYERDLKISNMSAVKLQLFVELIQAGLPAGTKLNVFQSSEEHEKERYVPDHDLVALQKELDALGGAPIDVNENPFFQPPLPLK